MQQPTLGQRLAALRKARGWSQEHTAQKLGISQQGYSLYENGGIVELPLSRLRQLCALFGITLDELLPLVAKPAREKERAHA